MTPGQKAGLDFAERVGATFLQAFLAVALVTGVSDLKALESALVAGGIAAAMFTKVKLNAYLGR